MPIKILNWNVEQFGTRRSAMAHRLGWVDGYLGGGDSGRWLETVQCDGIVARHP